MLFQTGLFLAFLVVVLAVYWRCARLRLPILALADALFYLTAGWANLALFLAASAITFVIGKRVVDPGGRPWLWLGVALNVANLATFKYAAFLTSNLADWLHLAWLDGVALQGLLLPIGISFYTFQHISYLVDRRRRDLPAAPSYLHFWVYISFFGHSIAGPIMRGHEFLPQVAAAPALAFDARKFHLGLLCFGCGLAKKVVVADHVAKWVDPLFAQPATLGFAGGWAAALLFAFQIYYDFSAYSDMAVGIGHMFGLSLPQNFRTPYVAANPREFWQRWHVTLSSWIRDYVYIPLGGNRQGVARGQLNLVVAMLASGLWHGANWTFVCWGAYHGALLLAARGWEVLKQRLGWAWFGSRAYHGLAVAAFFVLTVASWVPFRSPSVEDALLMYGGMLHPAPGGPYGQALALGAGLYALVVAEWWVRERMAGAQAWWLERVPALAQGMGYALVTAVLVMAYGGNKDFIYFKF